MKYLILIILIVILISLGTALLQLFRGGDTAHMLRSLTWRIGLSVALIVLLFIASALGLIQPHQPGF